METSPELWVYNGRALSEVSIVDIGRANFSGMTVVNNSLYIAIQETGAIWKYRDASAWILISNGGFFDSQNETLQKILGYDNNLFIGIINSSTGVEIWELELPTSEAPTNTSIPIDIELGNEHSCVVLSVGTIKCWGMGSYGRLVNALEDNQLTPVVVNGISNATKVTAGGFHSCAILNDKTIKCWGRGDYGQLGNGSLVNNSAPQTVSGISTAVQISAELNHTCALLEDNTVKCWGRNTYSQLGNGKTSDSSTPILVSGISNASQISVSDTHSCALLADKTIKCWGSNDYCQINNSCTGTSFTPFTITSINNATKVSTGLDVTCALLESGEIKCWGRQLLGRLGNGSDTALNTGQSTPVNVSGISTATNMPLTGKEHNCAVLTNGAVKCWGGGNNGQLGNGLTDDQSEPVTVSNISSPTKISAGGSHTCVILSDYSVKCWGHSLLLGSGDSSLIGTTAVTVTNIP